MATPRTGDLFMRRGNDGIFVLVITVERETAEGWLVYAVMMYPNGGLSAPRMVQILPGDKRSCENFPFSYGTHLAFVRQMQIRGSMS